MSSYSAAPDPEHHELRVAAGRVEQQVRDVAGDVQALLRVEPVTIATSGASRRRQAEPLLQRALVGGALVQPVGVEGRRDVRGRSPGSTRRSPGR